MPSNASECVSRYILRSKTWCKLKVGISWVWLKQKHPEIICQERETITLNWSFHATECISRYILGLAKTKPLSAKRERKKERKKERKRERKSDSPNWSVLLVQLDLSVHSAAWSFCICLILEIDYLSFIQPSLAFKAKYRHDLALPPTHNLTYKLSCVGRIYAHFLGTSVLLCLFLFTWNVKEK